MAQPLETKDSAPTDSERVYCTNALIVRVGGAVAVSLEDATLPGMAKNKHMTIMYRRGKKWSNDEIELISKETDNWIKQKYGSNQAPVTFTYSPWGKKSVQIEGDLKTLCLHLREKFGSMSSDEQRIPHVELFKNKNNNNNNNKACHICGESGHFKRNCPQKEDKKGGKKYKKDKKDRKYKKDTKDNGDKKGEKVKQRLGRMISKMDELKQRKQREIQLLDEQEKQLQELLNNADNLDNKTLRNEIKNIAKSFKNKRKEFKGRNNCNHNKRKKHGGIRKFKQSKQSKQSKQERKELNKQKKQQRKLEKEERKRLKKEKLVKLTAARLDELPLNTDKLDIYVDGYNIIGCDAICRKNMRGKGGGMRKSRTRLTKLLQENFINKFKSNQLKYQYQPKLFLWFDGNGKNTKYGDIEITFSTKKQIVDDKLVEKFSKNDKKQNSNILVITTDKELTLRLYDIGVKVMKSSTFYKTYLTQKIDVNPTDDNDDNDNDDNDDEKKEEFVGGTNEDDDFVQIIANKMNSMQYEDEDTPDGDGDGDDDDDDDDEGNYTPDEIEGDQSGNHYYQTPENDEEDYEFTSIFGEDMDIIDFD